MKIGSTSLRRPQPATVISMIALFISISGTAMALPGTNTVNSGDIINGEVKSPDIATNGVKTGEILDGQVRNSDLRADAVDSSKVLDESLGAADLGVNSVGSSEIGTSAVGSDELGSSAAGTSEVAANAIRASELGDGIVDRFGTAVTVGGGTAHNGAYSVESATASCLAGEELIGGHGQWSNDTNPANDEELFIAEVILSHGSESVTVDGGNDSGTDRNLQAVATCLQV